MVPVILYVMSVEQAEQCPKEEESPVTADNAGDPALTAYLDGGIVTELLRIYCQIEEPDTAIGVVQRFDRNGELEIRVNNTTFVEPNRALSSHHPMIQMLVPYMLAGTKAPARFTELELETPPSTSDSIVQGGIRIVNRLREIWGACYFAVEMRTAKMQNAKTKEPKRIAVGFDLYAFNGNKEQEIRVQFNAHDQLTFVRFGFIEMLLRARQFDMLLNHAAVTATVDGITKVLQAMRTGIAQLSDTSSSSASVTPPETA